MSMLRLFSTRLHGLLRREAVIGDIDEEMRLHIEMETEANIERGMPPAEARRAALGLRMALGAQPCEVLKLILRQGFLLTLIGISLGVAGALALTRLMSGLLFEVGATDPATFAAIVLIFTLVALIACYIPARRATRVDPLIALRYD